MARLFVAGTRRGGCTFWSWEWLSGPRPDRRVRAVTTPADRGAWTPHPPMAERAHSSAVGVSFLHARIDRISSSNGACFPLAGLLTVNIQAGIWSTLEVMEEASAALDLRYP